MNDAPGTYTHLGWLKEPNDVPRYYVEWSHEQNGETFAVRHSLDQGQFEHAGEDGAETELREIVENLYAEGRLLPPNHEPGGRFE